MSSSSSSSSSSSTKFTKLWPHQLRLLRRRLLADRLSADSSLVSLALSHYTSFYGARRAFDPVAALAAPWATPLERAAHWLGGPRPSALIHLVYSESSLRFESQLDDLLLGVHSGDLGDLEPNQFIRIDAIQRRTIDREICIERKLWDVQEGLLVNYNVCNGGDDNGDIEEKVVKLGGVVASADELRMETLESVVGVLKPRQAVDLLVAVVDMELGIRDLGLELEVEQCSG